MSHFFFSARSVYLRFGVPSADLPDPDTDFKKFCAEITVLNNAATAVFCPLTKKPEKWINMKKLVQDFGTKGGSGGGGGGGGDGRGVDLGQACCVVA